MKILAAIDSRPSSRRVLVVARTLASMPAVDVEALHVHTRESDARCAASLAEALGMPLRVLVGNPSSAILQVLDDDDAVMVVVGTGGPRGLGDPVGPVSRDVVVHAAKPVVVVPSEPIVAKAELPATPATAKVVVPLDGDDATAGALSEMLDRLAEPGMEVLAVHVGTATISPRYWDHFYYDFPAWHGRIWQSGCRSATRPLQLRHGAVVPEVVSFAISEGATLIAVAWSQDVSPGHAAVVKGLLSSTSVPVVLVPVTAAHTGRDARSLTGTP